MKIRAFARRNAMELIRDRLNLGFGLGFPIILLLLLALIGRNAPVPMFQIGQLTPGIAVFGLSFVSLFSGMMIARDRSSSLMLRLFTSPMKPSEFTAGYILPLMPIALCQSLICYMAAVPLGLRPSVHMIPAILGTLPSAVCFIGLGVLAGCLFNEKQVGGFCGALLTNLSAWLSGTWFDPSIAGRAFNTVASVMPFRHGVDAGRLLLAGEYGSSLAMHMIWVCAWAAVILLLSILVLQKKIKEDK